MKRKSETELESISWAELPIDPLLSLFSFLEPLDLCRCALVNTHWNSLVGKDEIWKRLCERDWSVEDRASEESFAELYKSQAAKWGKYIHCYAGIKKTWTRIERWVGTNAPEILSTFNEGATEKELDEFEKQSGLSLTPEMRCVLRIHNGQKNLGAHTKVRRLGLFGGYKVYDYHVNLYFCSLEKMGSFRKSVVNSQEEVPGWLKYCLPIARSYNGWKHIFSFMGDRPDKSDFKKGKIIEPTQNYQHVFPVAESFALFLEDFANSLETGQYKVSQKHKEIIRYPSKIGCSQATTKGVSITCSPLFVPERSSVSAPSSYFFAYRISMTMGEHMSKADNCKLLTRHWIITHSNNHVEEARGPGVIGKYPEMYPGAFFEYASCCPIPTPTGSMKGTFQMKTETGSTFDAEVPEYFFRSPKALEWSANE